MRLTVILKHSLSKHFLSEILKTSFVLTESEIQTLDSFAADRYWHRTVPIVGTPLECEKVDVEDLYCDLIIGPDGIISLVNSGKVSLENIGGEHFPTWLLKLSQDKEAFKDYIAHSFKHGLFHRLMVRNLLSSTGNLYVSFPSLGYEYQYINILYAKVFKGIEDNILKMPGALHGILEYHLAKNNHSNKITQLERTIKGTISKYTSSGQLALDYPEYQLLISKVLGIPTEALEVESLRASKKRSTFIPKLDLVALLS